jgi:hypothetical protein
VTAIDRRTSVKDMSRLAARERLRVLPAEAIADLEAAADVVLFGIGDI